MYRDSRKFDYSQIIVSLIIAFLISPCLSFATTKASDATRRSSDATDSTPSLIAGIDNPTENTYRTVEFTLAENRILRLYALGAASSTGMLDYGGIENSEAGQLVWAMHTLSGGKPVSIENRGRITEQQLMDAHRRSSNYYGNSFPYYRLAFWICAAVLSSGIAIWTIVYLVRKALSLMRGRVDNANKNPLIPGVIKWIAAIGGLLCTAYIGVTLTIPYAFEYVAMLGMPRGLGPHQIALIHIPKFGVFLTLFLLVSNGLVWARRYWSILERVHFVLITLSAVVFTSIAYHLDLIILS